MVVLQIYNLLTFYYSTDYGVNFFKQFTVVMNALDNRGNV